MQIGSGNDSGFTYVGLLIVVVLFGLGSVGAARLLASSERSEREKELLFIGHQFRQAIRSYVESGPIAGQFPATLEDLLFDSRTTPPRRHLRKIFVDPVTGKRQWGMVSAPEGGIMGVYSLSELEPMKKSNFRTEDSHFAAKTKDAHGVTKLLNPMQQTLSKEFVEPLQPNADRYSYRDWVFLYCRDCEAR
ncbi:MAG: type II secretion system protein [Rhodoferax sp.]|nr:type II secretion system protein [Rhodoferax sp.]